MGPQPPQFRGSDGQPLPDSGNWAHLDTVAGPDRAAGAYTTTSDPILSADWAGYNLPAPMDPANKRDFLGTDLGQPVNVAAGASIDAMLDNGAYGLGWFDKAISLYHNAFGQYPPAGSSGPIDLNKLEAAYDMQRGMKLDALIDTAHDLATALTSMSDAVNKQTSAAGQLPTAWGDAAGGDVAHNQLQALVQAASGDLDSMNSKPKLILDTVEAIRQCVQRKADAFNKLKDVKGIAGVSMYPVQAGMSQYPADADIVIKYGLDENAVSYGGNAPEQILHLDPSPTGSDRSSKIHQACASWMNQVFKETVEGYVTAYFGLCEDTDKAITDLFTTLSAALNDVDQHTYPAPAVTPAAPGRDNTPASTAPASSSLTSASAAPLASAAMPSTPASPASPSSANPASNDLGLGQVSQFLQQGASQFEQLAQQGLSQLGQLAQQGIGQLEHGAEQLFGGHSDDSASAGRHHLPDPHQLAEFDVPGGRMTVSQTPDGSVTMEVEGPDGKSHPFTFTVQDGKPLITEGAPAQSDSTASAAIASAAASPVSTIAASAADTPVAMTAASAFEMPAQATAESIDPPTLELPLASIPAWDLSADGQPGATDPNHPDSTANPVAGWVSAADQFDHGRPSASGPTDNGQTQPAYRPGPSEPEHHRASTGIALQETDPM